MQFFKSFTMKYILCGIQRKRDRTKVMYIGIFAITVNWKCLNSCKDNTLLHIFCELPSTIRKSIQAVTIKHFSRPQSYFRTASFTRRRPLSNDLEVHHRVGRRSDNPLAQDTTNDFALLFPYDASIVANHFIHSERHHCDCRGLSSRCFLGLHAPCPTFLSCFHQRQMYHRHFSVAYRFSAGEASSIAGSLIAAPCVLRTFIATAVLGTYIGAINQWYLIKLARQEREIETFWIIFHSSMHEPMLHSTEA